MKHTWRLRGPWTPPEMSRALLPPSSRGCAGSQGEWHPLPDAPVALAECQLSRGICSVVGEAVVPGWPWSSCPSLGIFLPPGPPPACEFMRVASHYPRGCGIFSAWTSRLSVRRRVLAPGRLPLSSPFSPQGHIPPAMVVFPEPTPLAIQIHRAVPLFSYIPKPLLFHIMVSYSMMGFLM
jgi:hypothetical protein